MFSFFCFYIVKVNIHLPLWKFSVFFSEKQIGDAKMDNSCNIEKLQYLY